MDFQKEITIKGCTIKLIPSSEVPVYDRCQGKRIMGAGFFPIPETNLKALCVYTRSYGKKSYSFDFGDTWSTVKEHAFSYFLDSLKAQIENELYSTTEGTLYVKEA